MVDSVEKDQTYHRIVLVAYHVGAITRAKAASLLGLAERANMDELYEKWLLDGQHRTLDRWVVDGWDQRQDDDCPSGLYPGDRVWWPDGVGP